MGVKVTAPTRIDVSAGWPDSDPFRKDLVGYAVHVEQLALAEAVA